MDKRPYHQTRRAEASEATRARILEAARANLERGPVGALKVVAPVKVVNVPSPLGPTTTCCACAVVLVDPKPRASDPRSAINSRCMEHLADLDGSEGRRGCPTRPGITVCARGSARA